MIPAIAGRCFLLWACLPLQIGSGGGRGRLPALARRQVGLDPWFDGKAEGSVFATLSSRTPAVA
jgi:hypothetical protein